MQRGRDALVRVVLFGATAALCVLPVAILHPRVGFDFIYFLPRLADTLLYWRRNGPSIQWWTPTFGGGLPVFPNPQDLQLSLPQLFSHFADPFVAVCLTFGLVTGLGCYALHRLARRVLGWEEAAACLLAVAGSTGGFLTTRMVVGHVSYHAMALTPLLLLLAMDREVPKRLALPLAALVAAYLVYSGGYFVSFAAPLALGMAMPLVALLAPRARPLLPAFGILAGAALLGFAIAAAKLYAVFSFMQSFPRLQAALPLPSVFSPLLQLTISPLFALAGLGGSPSALHRSLFSQPWGVWETDASLALPVVLAAFAAIPALLLHVLRRGTPRERGLAFAVFGLGAFVVVLTAATGPVFEWVLGLPGVSSFRVTARFAGTLGLPICLIGVFVIRDLASRRPRGTHPSWALWGLVALALLQQAGYAALVREHPRDLGVWFDARVLLESVDRMRADPAGVAPVARIERVTDPIAVATGRSSLLVYEPLLGSFVDSHAPFLRRTPLVVGPADEIRDGAFNTHFPPAFSHSRALGLAAFSRIPAGEREALDRFLAGRPPGWELPPAQRVANGVSVAALLGAGVWLLALLHPRLRRA